MSFNTPGTIQPKKKHIWPYIVGAIAIVFIYFVVAFFWTIKTWQPKATAFAERFHAEYNGGEYDKLYDEADVRFKNAITREEWTKLLTMIDTKLGKQTQSSQVNIYMNKTTNGTFLVVNFSSAFEHDTGTEVFTLLTTGDRLTLVGYRVNSKALLVK